MAVWGDSLDMRKGLQEPVHLLFTSPPYLLSRSRDYGNPASEAEFVDFIVALVEPVMRNLVPGGSVCLNMGQDVFVRGTPARSLILERVTLALHDRLGLSLMDRSVWHNPSKPPGPTIWASRERVQLNSAFEFVVHERSTPGTRRQSARTGATHRTASKADRQGWRATPRPVRRWRLHHPPRLLRPGDGWAHSPQRDDTRTPLSRHAAAAPHCHRTGAPHARRVISDAPSGLLDSVPDGTWRSRPRSLRRLGKDCPRRRAAAASLADRGQGSGLLEGVGGDVPRHRRIRYATHHRPLANSCLT